VLGYSGIALTNELPPDDSEEIPPPEPADLLPPPVTGIE